MVTLSVYSLCFVSSVFQRKTLSVPGLDLSAALLQICEPFYSPYPTAMTTDLKKMKNAVEKESQPRQSWRNSSGGSCHANLVSLRKSAVTCLLNDA